MLHCGFHMPALPHGGGGGRRDIGAPPRAGVGVAPEVSAFAAPAGDCVDYAAYELPHAALALGRSEQAAEVLLDDDVGRLLRPRLRELAAVLLEQRLVGGAGDTRATLLPLDLVERVVSSLVLRLAKASPGLVPLAVFFMFRSLRLRFLAKIT